MHEQDIRLGELCGRPGSLNGTAVINTQTDMDAQLLTDAEQSGMEVITLELSETKAVTQQLPKKQGTIEVGTASVSRSRIRYLDMSRREGRSALYVTAWAGLRAGKLPAVPH